MSWKVSGLEHLRMEFVLIAKEPEVSFSEVCRQFGISRKTGYKWLYRYECFGLSGLRERSRRPHTSPLMMGVEVVEALVRLRLEHPYWGPKKLRVLLLREGFSNLPGVATIGRFLLRTGLSESKGRGRPRRSEPTGDLREAFSPNDVWTVDFKGWWRTGDGSRCEPLTIRDLFSRYILCLKPVKSRSAESVRGEFEEVFTRYGLPSTIRADNGGPFSSVTGPYGLTRLSAWWRSLGIILERTAPGHPEENGSHERMHGDIAREVEGHPAPTLDEEARRLERWRIEYNVVRPHEALGMRTPGEVYRRSSRCCANMRPYSYPPAFEERRVRRDGCIRFEGESVYVSEALSRFTVGLERTGNHRCRVWFCDLPVCEIDLLQGTSLRPSASASCPA